MRILQQLDSTPVMRVPGSGRVGRQARAAIEGGHAIRPLPGILMASRVRDDPRAWILANWLWRPTSVITGRAALNLHGVTEVPVPVVDAILPYTFPDRGLLRFRRASPPGSLITDLGMGLAAVPSAAALFLGVQEDWEPICAALRRGITTPEEIRAARELLSRQRDAGAMDRTVRCLSQSPWSVPELELHQLLRLVGITGWQGNLPVLVHPGGRSNGRLCYPDAGFTAEKLAVEVASEQYHNSSEAFSADALRARWFAAEGWTQMPVTPRQLRTGPNDFLSDLCAQLHRSHRPAGLPRVEHSFEAPFWRRTDGIGW